MAVINNRPGMRGPMTGPSGLMDLVSQSQSAPSGVPSQPPSGGKGGGVQQAVSDFASPDRMARMTMALNSMRTRPDRTMALNAAQTVQSEQKRQAQKQQANRTAEWLESQGASQYADMARQGFPSEALKAYQAARTGDTDLANQMALAAFKAGLKPGERQKPIIVGDTVLDPETYQPVYTAPKDPTEGLNAGTGRRIVEGEDGSITAQVIPGTAAAAEQKAAESERQAQDLKLSQMRRRVTEVISDVPSMEAYSGRSGRIPGGDFVRGIANPDYESWLGKLDQVLGQLTLEELGKMKGTASESDMIKVEQAAAALRQGGSMEENMRALRDIYEVLGGSPSDLPDPSGERSWLDQQKAGFRRTFGLDDQGGSSGGVVNWEDLP